MYFVLVEGVAVDVTYRVEDGQVPVAVSPLATGPALSQAPMKPKSKIRIRNKVIQRTNFAFILPIPNRNIANNLLVQD